MSLESISRLAALTGFAPRTVTRRLERLTPAKSGKALLYETRDALPLLYRVDQGEVDPARARAALDAARTREIELRIAEREGALVPVAEVQESWARQITTARNSLLALPSRVAHECASTSDPARISEIIRVRLYEILRGLAGQDDDGRPRT